MMALSTKKAWRKLPVINAYEEYHPCLHRWLKDHKLPQEPKQTRYIAKPLNEVIDTLAKPLCRRLLTLYLSYYERFPENRQLKLVSRLVECGFTEDELKDLLEKDKRRKEIKNIMDNAGPFDVFDEDGNLLPMDANYKRRSKKKRPKVKVECAKNKNKSKIHNKQQKNKQKTKVETEDAPYKKVKAGQLRDDWPHRTALELMVKVWALADAPPDERYISAAPQYFDVQASAILQVVCRALGENIAPDTAQTTYEKKIIRICLNLAVWIAKRVTAPAQLIQENDIRKMLSMRGEELKNNMEVREDDEDKSHQRSWMPTDDDSQSVEVQHSNGMPTPLQTIKQTDREHEIDQFYFLQNAKWYNPTVPEFMYAGPRDMPKNVTFSEINGFQLWSLDNFENPDPQPLIPQTVQLYFPHLSNQNPTSLDPWYIMNQPEFYQVETLKWETASTIDTVQMAIDLVKTLVTTPDVTMTRFLEELASMCQAIRSDEEVQGEDQAIDDKRTIILERLFVSFFTANFRDFNAETEDYMRILCHRVAVLIRYLYQHTAVTLWQLQKHHVKQDTQSEESVEDMALDAEIQFETWKQRLDLLRGTMNLTNKWKEWLQNVAHSLELPEFHNKITEEANEWLANHEQARTITCEMDELVQNLQLASGVFISEEESEEAYDTLADKFNDTLADID